MNVMTSDNVTMAAVIPNREYECVVTKIAALISTPLTLIGRHSENVLGLLDLIGVIKNRVKIMVEVGSFRGESTAIFGRYIEKVYAVDPFIWCSGIAERDFDKLTSGLNITKIKKYSIEASSDFEDNSLDFVYIDAAHDYENVTADIKSWLPKIKENGLIGGHDYHDLLTNGVVKSVNEIFNTDKGLIFMDSSWLFEKIDVLTRE